MRLIRVGQENLANPDPWAIKGTVGGLTVIWGQPGSYKTFLAISMAIAVASGKDWFGKPVRKGPVIYVVGEGGNEMFKRRVTTAALAIGLSHEFIEQMPLFMTQGPMDFSKDRDFLADKDEWDAVQPALIVVDTVSRCLVGDENKQEAMQAFVAMLDSIKYHYGCAIVAVHHSNKIGQLRGSTVLPSAADVVIKTARKRTHNNERLLSLTVEKLKDLDTDGFEPSSLALAITDVRHEDDTLMLDEYGDKMTTLILAELPETAPREEVVLKTMRILQAERNDYTALGFKEIVEHSHLSKSTVRRALEVLLKMEAISQPHYGQYFIGEREESYLPGENYDTSEDERMRAAIKEVEDEKYEDEKAGN